MSSISQEFFDETVEENISLFGMSKENALEETIHVFQMQGADLSKIDTSGGIGVEEIVNNIELLKTYVQSVNYNSESEINAVIQAMDDISKSCVSSKENLNKYAVRNQNLVSSKGICMHCCEFSQYGLCN